MQEENYESPEYMNKSIEDLFLGTQETYSEAQQRAMEENKSFQKTEFFRMDKFGIYRLRILPLAPNKDGSINRKSYEYPVYQMLLELEKPSAGGKPSYMYVTVPRVTEAGYPIDLIDVYRKAAVNAANEKGDEKLAEKIGGGSFGGGLKFNYGHVMYIFDMNERAKGLQLLTLSHSQFKELDERKFKLWQKKLSKNPNYPCPVSSVYNAYPVEIEKKKNGAKTEYLTSIDNESDNDILTVDELNALMSAPRIPEVVYRYSRYQFEATLEFLKQCDIKYEMDLMESEEMKEAIETLQAALPKEDTSSFSFDKRTKDSKENSSEIRLDDLYNRFDDLQNKGLGDKTEEGQELRALIRTYIEQEKLNIRVTRSTTNEELFDMIEKGLEEGTGNENTQEEEKEADPEAETEKEETETERTRRRR
ncbi:hypothetical protein IR083_07250 [Dysgonomonas sp. GY75]|uniref:hypothetical protein n=1 Tax=Dysgonomonas sp. GY75 TaxID=2780419 RepID=UPI001883C43E|nr:hypothetical protein [Dysgonomonas sp. GY75]MBF0648611.1 hypothetical protein [Dysgonomonas sp. GY75]